MMYEVKNSILDFAQYVPIALEYGIKEFPDRKILFEVMDLPDGTLLRMYTYVCTEDDEYELFDVTNQKLVGVKIVLNEDGQIRLYDENKNLSLSNLAAENNAKPITSTLVSEENKNDANNEPESDNEEQDSIEEFDSSIDKSEDESNDEQASSEQHNESECIEGNDTEIRNDEPEDEIEPNDEEPSERTPYNRGYEENNYERTREESKPDVRISISSVWEKEYKSNERTENRNRDQREGSSQRNTEFRGREQLNKPNKHYIGVKKEDKATYHPNNNNRHDKELQKKANEAIKENLEKVRKKYGFDFDFSAIAQDAYSVK